MSPAKFGLSRSLVLCWLGESFFLKRLRLVGNRMEVYKVLKDGNNV